MQNYHPNLTNSEVGAIEDFNRKHNDFSVGYSPRKRRFVLFNASGVAVDSQSEVWDVIASPVIGAQAQEIERLRA